MIMVSDQNSQLKAKMMPSNLENRQIYKSKYGVPKPNPDQSINISLTHEIEKGLLKVPPKLL